ncbi:hypothetical protein FRC20_011883 [Serendipita sp. 405]|nr:hypothetical protein FRC20_011883 [Serendipita sp. 405]
MTTIKSLPVEILSEIITFVAHETFSPPISLLTVSKGWRDVVLNSPLAWGALSIECGSENNHPPMPVVELCIRNSGVAPLFLSLDLELAFAQAIPILQPCSLLLQNKERIRELDIHNAGAWNLWNLVHFWPATNLVHFRILQRSQYAMPLELLELPLFQRNRQQAPRLHTLLLEHCAFDDGPAHELTSLQELHMSSCSVSTEGFKDIMKTCPSLRKLVFKGVVGKECPFTLVSMLPNLQELDLISYNSGIKRFLDTLRMCPNLRRLSFGHITDNSHSYTPIDQVDGSWDETITMKHIRELDVGSREGIRSLQTVVIPSLTHLTLTCGHIKGALLEIMLRFISQHDKNLQYLKLTLRADTPDVVILTLPDLSGLVTLYIDVWNIDYHPRRVFKHTSLLKFYIQVWPPLPDSAGWEEIFHVEPKTFEVSCPWTKGPYVSSYFLTTVLF